MTQITSRDNPKIKQIRSLRLHKQREATGLFLVEGIRHVGEAAAASRERTASVQVAAICYAPELLTSEFGLSLVQEQDRTGVPCYAVSREVFATLADKENPQGIVAAVSLRQPSLAELNPANFPWAVALVAPQDPGNIGSILRTIDAVGASGLLLLDSSADPTHPSSVRASMGSLFWYPVVRTSFEDFAHWKESQGYTVYGTSAKGEVDYREVKPYQPPMVLLMGSEREGLSPAQRERCHTLIRLPMRGRVSSLNLSVATGILLYSMLS